jgi:hypothetical protein
MYKNVQKKVILINSSQNEGLSPSCIALSFNAFGSVSWRSMGDFSALLQFSLFVSDFQFFFDLSATEEMKNEPD